MLRIGNAIEEHALLRAYLHGASLQRNWVSEHHARHSEGQRGNLVASRAVENALGRNHEVN